MSPEFEAALDAMVARAEHAHAKADDPVNHPKHYTSNGSGIECIDVTEHMTFNLGNAVKYIWRAGLKSPDATQDLEKAIFYLRREIQRIRKP